MNLRPYLFMISLTRSQIASVGSFRDLLIFIEGLVLTLLLSIIVLWIAMNLEMVSWFVVMDRRGVKV